MIYIWLALIVIFFVIEAFTMDLFSIWFTFGALASFVLTLFYDNLLVEIVVFFVVSFALLFFTRPAAKKYFIPRKVRTNIDRIIGQKAIVTRTIAPLVTGEVKIEGKYWSALPVDDSEFKENDTVSIVSIQGAKVYVKKI